MVSVYLLLVNNNKLQVSVLSWWVGSLITEVENEDNAADRSSFKEEAVVQSTIKLLVEKLIHFVNMKIFAWTKTCWCKTICHTSSYFRGGME